MAKDEIKNGLIVNDLSMTYRTEDGNEVNALEDINFKMQQGDLVVVVGPSGCGKTTLLNIIAGFLSPTKGNVVLNGIEITGPGAERGVVFQQGALFEWLTVYENTAFGLKMRGIPEAERRKKVLEYLNWVGLGEVIHTPIYHLSGGMQQRVAIARSLVNDPSVMLMDEPLGALDALTREKMQSLILKIWSETKKMTFFITHSVEEAIYLATDLFVLSTGPGKILKRYKLDFSKMALDIAPRKLKSDPEFINVREEVLSMIWGMEEQTIAQG